MSDEIYVVGSYGVAFWISGEVPAAGETVLGTGFAFGNGGKGSNQAIGASRLGGRVRLLASIGNDKFGDEAIALWAYEGVDHSAIKRIPDEPTMAGIIILDDEGENRIITDLGANARLTPDDVARFSSDWTAPGVLLTQMEIPLDTVATALSIGREKGLTTILNPAPARTLPREVLRNVDILTPNQSEARMLLGYAPDDPRSDEAIIGELLDLGVGQVVMTMGARGAAISAPDGTTFVAGHKMEVVDTTGAGDSFNGALATALTQGHSLADAVRRANGAGALTVTRKLVVPALPTLPELETLLASKATP